MELKIRKLKSNLNKENYDSQIDIIGMNSEQKLAKTSRIAFS